MSTPNTLKAALKRGEKQIGLWLTLGSPTATEICARAGLDWLRRRYPEGAFEDLSRQTAKPLGLFRVPGSGSGPPLQRPPGE